MCPESQRADALNAVTLIENVARLATQGLFGFVFASLAEVGKAYATFYCNAVSELSPLHIPYPSDWRTVTVKKKKKKNTCPQW